MAEHPAEAETSSGAPIPSSPAAEQPVTSTGETPAEASTAPGEDFHDAEHWATLTGGVS
jgi:hypothetical protein